MHIITDNEKAWLNGLKAGSEEAFTAIYRHYFDDLYLYAFRVLKDEAAAEDIVQELFLGLWQQRASLHINVSLKAYLYTANRYQLIKAVRNNTKQPSLFERLEERIWGDPGPDNLLLQKELQARLHHVISDLPEKCREIYRLSREEHLSHKEIAEKLEISAKTVENQIAIALKKIRLSMRELLPLLAMLIK